MAGPRTAGRWKNAPTRSSGAPGWGVAVKRGSGGRRVTDLRLMPRWGAGGVDTDPGAPAEVGTRWQRSEPEGSRANDMVPPFTGRRGTRGGCDRGMRSRDRWHIGVCFLQGHWATTGGRPIACDSRVAVDDANAAQCEGEGTGKAGSGDDRARGCIVSPLAGGGVARIVLMPGEGGCGLALRADVGADRVAGQRQLAGEDHLGNSGVCIRRPRAT